MSTTLEDIYYDQYLEDQALQDKIYDEVENLKRDNLRSYYLKNKDVYKTIVNTQKTASKLRRQKFLAPSFVYFNICIEQIFKYLFIFPILSGSVLDEDIAEILINQMFNENLSKFDKLILHLVNEFGGLDLIQSKGEKEKSLWNEIILVRQKRNKIIHRGESCNISELSSAEHIARILVEKVIPNLMKKLKLKTGNDHLITEA